MFDRNIFSQAKKQLNIISVAKRYGIQLDRYNKACCPFHQDKTPSFIISREKQRFHCFGCGADGDVIDLVSKLMRITPLEALKELNSIYNLAIEMDKPLNPSTVQQYRYDDSLLSAFEKKCKTLEDIIAHYCRLLARWKNIYKPEHTESPFHPLFQEACLYLDYFTYLHERIFIAGSFKDKALFCKIYESGVLSLAKRLEQIRKNCHFA